MRISKPISFSLLALLLVAFGVPVAKALPSLISHVHDSYHVRWGSQSGSSGHNHRSIRSFRGWNDFGEPYSAYACWDDRNFRTDVAGGFDLGHCFIDEGTVADRPTYAFDGNVPAGARARIRDAFNRWGAIGSDSVNRRTGIAFREVTSQSQADIRVLWTNLVDNGPGGSCGGKFDPALRHLSFDSTFNSGHGTWNFTSGSTVADDEWHFPSVALHEVGHVVGLVHQNDEGSDVMAPGVGEPEDFDCTPDGETALIFTQIDGDSVEGARDLYSQTVANPVTGWVYCENLYSTYHECEAIPVDGVPPFTYRWSNGSTSYSWSGSCYSQSPSVRITDSRGLSASYTGPC